MGFCKNCGAKIDTHKCYSSSFCTERCHDLYMDAHPDEKRAEGTAACWILGSMGYVFGLKSIFHFGVVYAIIGFIVLGLVCTVMQEHFHNSNYKLEKAFFWLSLIGILLLVVDIAVLVFRMFMNQ